MLAKGRLSFGMLSWKDAESQVVPPKHQNVKMRMKQQKEGGQKFEWMHETLSVCVCRLLHLPYPHVVSSNHPSCSFSCKQRNNKPKYQEYTHNFTIYSVPLSLLSIWEGFLFVGKDWPWKCLLVNIAWCDEDQKEEKEPQTWEIDCKLRGNCSCHYFPGCLVWTFSLLISFRMDCKATTMVFPFGRPLFLLSPFRYGFPSHANHSLQPRVSITWSFVYWCH